MDECDALGPERSPHYQGRAASPDQRTNDSFLLNNVKRVDEQCLKSQTIRDGYLVFGTLEETINGLSILRVLARPLVLPKSPYGYVELEIALCLPASFASPPSVGPGSRIERVQFSSRQHSEN